MEDEQIKTIYHDNLTELLLNLIRKYPSMFLGTANINKLAILIQGYRLAIPTDFYFDESFGFLVWNKDKYKSTIANLDVSYWQQFFLNQTNDDEYEALMLYFFALEEYYKEYRNHHSSSLNK